MEAVVAIWGLWTAGGIAGELYYKHSIDRIAHRFLIGGFRGKSSLTRLLNETVIRCGIDSLGRITGDAPTILLPDGTSEVQRRIGPANIREMRRVMRRAASENRRAVCIENMAVKPDLVRVVSEKAVRPTVYLHAWDAPDHLEHYPSDAKLRAAAVAETLPRNCPIILIEDSCNHALRDELLRTGRDLRMAGTVGTGRAELLAAAVATALDAAGISGNPDVEMLAERAAELMRISVYTLEGRRYIDLLSANDPQSSRTLVEEALSRTGNSERVANLYFHRIDRGDRLVAFAPLLKERRSFICGDAVPRRVEQRLFEGRVGKSDPAGIEAETIFLMGNANGAGATMRGILQAHGTVEKW